MDDNVAVLGIVHAAVAEVQRLVALAIVGVIVRQAMDVHRDGAIVDVGEAQRLEPALGAIDRGVDVDLLEAIVVAGVVVDARRLLGLAGAVG